MQCDLCDKKPSMGKRVSRLGHGAMHQRVKSRTSRMFHPNIQRVRTMNGRIKVCTSCIRAGKVVK